MERTLIRELGTKVGESVVVMGHVSVRRDQGKMVFFDIRDRSGVVQGVVLPQSEALEAAKETRVEYIVSITALVNKRPEKNINPEIQNGDIELEIKDLEILSRAEIPFELGTEVNIDTHLDHLPFTLRAPKNRDIFAMQATIIEAFRSSLRAQEFTEFQAPSLVGADAEGGAAAFEVDYYYDQKAFLATSPQLYKQMMVGALERVFATPKAFRGEKHATSRHLSEYSSLDFEMGFIKDHTDVMQVLEKVMRKVVSEVSLEHSHLFGETGAPLPLLPEKIPVLKLAEAQEIIEREFGGKAVGESDLEPEHERQICEWAVREHGSEFIFITHYPISKRAFYTYEDENDLGFTKSFDLLFRGLEITSGGQRVHNHDDLVERMKAKGLEPEKFSYYLQAFKAGMPPHGGTGTGLERLTARLLNIPNVKQTTLFPRDINRIDTLLSTDQSPKTERQD